MPQLEARLCDRCGAALRRQYVAGEQRRGEKLALPLELARLLGVYRPPVAGIPIAVYRAGAPRDRTGTAPKA